MDKPQKKFMMAGGTVLGSKDVQSMPIVEKEKKPAATKGRDS